MLVAMLAAQPASAAPVIGISEASPPVFSDPHFRALNVPTTRLLVAYDTVAAARRGDDELRDRVEPYLANAAASGVTPLVAFQHSRGDRCWKRPSPSTCHLPSVRRYRLALRAFLERFPSVRVISPWTEINHPAQPTYRHPRRAARYTNVAADLCRDLRRRCTIVVADLLDVVDRQQAKPLRFTRTEAWVRRFRSALRVPRRICGIHNYSDVNRFRKDGTRALIRALDCKRYWLTEVGGIYRFGSFWKREARASAGCRSAAACQLKATKYLFRVLGRFRRIRRAYVHSWYTFAGQRFDAALVRGDWESRRTRPRPAYYAVRRWIRRHHPHRPPPPPPPPAPAEQPPPEQEPPPVIELPPLTAAWVGLASAAR